MKRLTAIVIIFSVVTLSVNAQKKTPEEKSIVNKEFDENGNLLKYDSTYVWQWSSDSTFNFSFGDDWAFGQNTPGMFGGFFNDSIRKKFGFLNDPTIQPFDNEDFFQHFGHSFPGLPFENDSVSGYHFGQPFQGNFGLGELDRLQKQLQEQFNQRNFIVPDRKSVV